MSEAALTLYVPRVLRERVRLHVAEQADGLAAEEVEAASRLSSGRELPRARRRTRRERNVRTEERHDVGSIGLHLQVLFNFRER